MTSAEAPLPRDGELRLYITRDGMEAHLTATAPGEGGRPVTRQQVEEALARAGVVHGIDPSALEQVLNPLNAEQMICVARGTPAVPGQDGYIDYCVELAAQRLSPAEGQDGRVDFHNVSRIVNVTRGTLLARRIDPQPGLPGRTVLGQEVPFRPGRPALLKRGKNTDFDDSGACLYATIDGQVSVADGRVSVLPVYEVPGDVDFHTGNIDFVGHVVVGGSVKGGFLVKAGGDVEVRGVIEPAAQVLAQGNVTVRQGIASGDKGWVQAGGFVAARFIENGRVAAGGDVMVQDAIIQSAVRSGGSVRVEGRKATIVGGHLQAREEVSARVLGSPLAPQTFIEVGIDPALRDEYRALAPRYRELKQQFEVVSRNLAVAQQSMGSVHNLPEKRRQALIKLVEEYQTLRGQLQAMEERRQQLEAEFARSQGGRVIAREVAHPGVHVTIGRAACVLNDPLKSVMFVLEEGEVKTTSAR